ncbi:MAG: hypothetical protein EA382_14170, partial [Spirochaetaceae bacterium]
MARKVKRYTGFRGRLWPVAAALVTVGWSLSATAGYAQQNATIEVAPVVALPMAQTPDLYEVAVGAAMQLSYPFADSPLAAFARVGY